MLCNELVYIHHTLLLQTEPLQPSCEKACLGVVSTMIFVKGTAWPSGIAVLQDLLLHKLTNHSPDVTLLKFMFVDEHLVDIGDDLVDYEVRL